MPCSLLSSKTHGSELVVRSTHASQNKRVYLEGTVFPLDAFTFSPRLSFKPLDGTCIEVPPLCYAVLTGSVDDVLVILAESKRTEQFQRDLDYGLFFASRSENISAADLLLKSGANPGRPFSSNALHGAASRGELDEIGKYASYPNVSIDVQDETFATPVIYAMDLDSPYDWETIKYLFMMGARPEAKVGTSDYTYAQIAREKGKEDLAKKLEGYKGWVGPLYKKSVSDVKLHRSLLWVTVRYECPEFPNAGWDHTSLELFQELDDDQLRREAKRMLERKISRRRGRRSIMKGGKGSK
ncbi:hypothetical protein FBEOM_13124 [Fusarium beomiforme]|uniref:Ankyrin repeat protein n=1 Tax=Fusarium beomiforme TaxID=44412 RepID=A0A9P5A7L4_9HYPO|nr:hypothetical protein FBEOM_13124 [Fusarium beomiforme]